MGNNGGHGYDWGLALCCRDHRLVRGKTYNAKVCEHGAAHWQHRTEHERGRVRDVWYCWKCGRVVKRGRWRGE